ncbi:hypothetical protein HY410_01885 [Candidatus Gottesmanbacteria bacterium]|nr:hypothetical protein [Candidatus Gottesmanbacteria bacterium]
MIRLLKQLSIWLLVGLLLLPSFTRPLYAATGTEWVANTVEDFVRIVGNVDIEKESFDTASLSNSILALACLILGCTDDPKNPFGYDKSAIAGLSGMAVVMYENPPANTYAFVRDMSQSLGFSARPAYAQGVGFTGLSALLPIWKVFRNIAYALLAIIMIVVGFMIMLRKKIDPKTVVTVQNAIPNIVITLILITFSYAIVGILIDLMYLVMGLSMKMIYDMNQTVFGDKTVEHYLKGNLGTALNGFFGAGWGAWDDILSFIPWQFQAGAVAIPGIIAAVFTGFSRTTIYALLAAPVLFFGLLALILLFGMIRLIFMLIDAYIHIIIALLIAPLQLAMGAMPGTNSFASWITNLVSKLIVFPITGILIMITFYLTSSTVNGNVWAPPLLAPEGASATGMAGIIGLGMLLGIPSIVGSIQKMLKAEPVVPGGVATIAGPVGTAAGQLINLAYQFSFISSAFRHGKQPPTPYATSIGAGTQGLSGIVRGGGEK